MTRGDANTISQLIYSYGRSDPNPSLPPLLEDALLQGYEVGVAAEDANAAGQDLAQQGFADGGEVDEVHRPAKGGGQCFDQLHLFVGGEGSARAHGQIDVTLRGGAPLCEGAEEDGDPYLGRPLQDRRELAGEFRVHFCRVRRCSWNSKR